MAETRCQDLPELDRRDALEVGERNSGYKAHLLEKDIIVPNPTGSLIVLSRRGRLAKAGSA